jgi:Flp pilus assembly protein TadG
MWKRRCRERGLTADQEGNAILELAIVLPVLFTIGLGVIEFGNLIYQYHLIWVGVRDAARYLSGLPADLPAVNQTAARNIATTGVISGGTNRISWWTPADVVITPTTVVNDDGFGNKLYRGQANITMVTVSTSVTYQSLGFLNYLGLGPITLSAQHEERIIGVR